MTTLEQFDVLDGVLPTKAINELILGKYKPILHNITKEISIVQEIMVLWLDYINRDIDNNRSRVILSIKYQINIMNDIISGKIGRHHDTSRINKELLAHHRNQLQNVSDNIRKDYTSYNYDASYIVFFEKNSFLYNINRKNLDLDVFTFKIGTINDNYGNEFMNKFLEKGLASKSNIGPEDYYDLEPFLRETGHNFHSFSPTNGIGWTKQKLIDALGQHELFKEEIIPIQKEYFYYNFDKYLTENRFQRRYPKLEELGLYYPDQEFEIYMNNEYRKKHPPESEFVNIKLEGNITKTDEPHSLLKRIPKYVLEQFYHKYFYPRLSKQELMNYQKSDILDIISRDITMKGFHREIPEISQALILQPGGRTYSKYMQQPGLFQKRLEVQVPQEYRKYLSNCDDVNVGRDIILYDIIELGLSNQVIRGMSKMDLCNIIKNYLKIHYDNI